ncbi:MAG TPA: ABC transporter ATP-binding protein/permease [Burkholderiales bacterium]|jgi:putative ATP-binding cassette transporter|nr:ABC transporter ATP-binding protein/permease [Burkholderiales bacterium]
MQTTGFLTAFWALAKPYWVSAERRRGLTLLGLLIGLSIGLVWLEVQWNSWNNDFYNALQNKDQAEFFRQLARFTLIAVFWVVARVYRLYFQQILLIEWRTWLNEHLLSQWLKDRAYYRLQLVDRGIDNPDQRIADDLRIFVEKTLELGVGLLSAVATLTCFIAILWTLSSDFSLGGVSLPGVLVWIAVVYALVGSFLAHRIGRRLIGLDFEQQRYEADYRYSLVRLRENSEGVALYRGESLELANFRERFAHVIRNWWGIVEKRKQLNWFVSFYEQFSIAFPYLVAAPRYFSGAVGMGFIFQTASAFRNVQWSLSWFVNSYTEFAYWKATVDRLTSFGASLDRVRAEAQQESGERSEQSAGSIGTEDLQLAVPQGKPLLAPTSLQLRSGEDVLITGPSGAGKSTFFRALAGIWPYWKGRVRLPKGARFLFLPQKPYLPIGSLKRAVTYPGNTSQFSDQQIADALRAVGLAMLAADLERSENWAQMLSGSEQQRLAFARALLNAPDWLFLDEATASLPEDDQEALYRLLKERLPGTTLVSIGHRASLRTQHARQLAWRGEQLAAA